MFKLAKNLKTKDIIVIFISFFLIFAQVWFELKMPDYMAEITKIIQNDRN